MTRFKVERFGGTQMPTNANITECCAHCGDDVKSRRREFSEQAYSALIVWGEIQAAAVDQAICDGCYSELREVLIDRADDIAGAASQQGSMDVRKQALAQDSAVKNQKSTKKLDTAPRPKVRKAG